MSTPRPFKQVSISPQYGVGHVIQWDLDPVFNDPGPYVFSVDIAEDPEFRFVIRSITANDNFFAIDSTRSAQAFNLKLMYRVKLVSKKASYFSPVLYLYSNETDRHKYLQAAEIIRKEGLLSVKSGYPCWILKRRAFGQIEKKNVDPITGIPRADNTQDFGTGVNGGYYPPLKSLYRRDSYNQEVKLEESGLGVTEKAVMGASLLSFPLLSVHDVLVDKDDLRYHVSNVVQRLYPGTNIVMKQNCSVNLIASTDTVYRIELPKLQ